MGFKTEKKTLKKEKNLLKQHLQVILFSWGTWKWWLPVVWREVTEEVNIRHLTASKTLMCSGKLAKGGWVSYKVLEEVYLSRFSEPSDAVLRTSMS